MAVTTLTGVATPVTGAETTVISIAGGPFDNVSVYYQGGLGGGGGDIGFALLATVDGTLTQIAYAELPGSQIPQLIEWQDPTNQQSFPATKANSETNQNVRAGGTSYTITIIDLSQQIAPATAVPRQPVTVTIAGVDEFDTVADGDISELFSLAPGASGALPAFSGWAQLMDVACDQSNLVNVTVTIFASNTGGLVAPIKEITWGGSGGTIQAVLRGLELPVATSFIVQITNNAQVTQNVTLTAITYSVVASSGGGGVVTLTGNANGPSNNNTVESFIIESVDASVPAVDFTHVGGLYYVGISGLSANVTVTLPNPFLAGSAVTVKDEDGSLANFNITVSDEGGATIDGSASVVMNAASPGPLGSYTFTKNGNGNWSLT
jgi:hypothetical protein